MMQQVIISVILHKLNFKDDDDTWKFFMKVLEIISKIHILSSPCINLCKALK